MKKKVIFRSCMLLTLGLWCTVHANARNMEDPKGLGLKKTTAQCLNNGNSMITHIHAQTFTSAQLTVENAAGKIILKKAIVLDPGSNALKFRIGELQEGFYCIKIKSGGETTIFPMVVR